MIHLPYPRLCECGIVHKTPVRSAWQLRPYQNLYLTDNAKGYMLDLAVDEGIATGFKYGSLHTLYSTTGANELTGGTPTYARKALTWSAAASGSKALAATLPTWDVPAGSTVAWVGFWDSLSTGNFWGMMPAGGAALQHAAVETATDITNNDIYAKAHGLQADYRVCFWGTLPTGLSVGTIYYVISTGLATDSFRVSATSGGASIDLTGTQPFAFWAQRCIPEAFAGQGTYSLSSGSVNLGAVA